MSKHPICSIQLTKTAEGKISQEKSARKAAESINKTLEEEKRELERTLEGGSDTIREIENKVKDLEHKKRQTESELNIVSNRLLEEEDTNSQLSNSIRKMDQELKRKKDDIDMMKLIIRLTVVASGP